MISQKLTLKESQEDLDFKLFDLTTKHKQNKFDVTDVADFLPVGLLINHKQGSNSYMNRVSESVLNMTVEESTGYGPEYQKKIVADQEEFKRLTRLINDYYIRNDESEILSFFQKIKPVGHRHYEWMYITSRLFKKEKEVSSNQRILIACPVNLMGDMTGKINRVLEENDFMKRNFRKFALLTKREKEILTLVAQGFNNPNIAEMLFISRHTVEQHRKNINNKIECRNFAEVIKFSIAFDLI